MVEKFRIGLNILTFKLGYSPRFFKKIFILKVIIKLSFCFISVEISVILIFFGAINSHVGLLLPLDVSQRKTRRHIIWNDAQFTQDVAIGLIYISLSAFYSLCLRAFVSSCLL